MTTDQRSEARYRMRETVGLILRARADVFDKVTAEDFAAFEREIDGPAVTYFTTELDLLERGTR